MPRFGLPRQWWIPGVCAFAGLICGCGANAGTRPGTLPQPVVRYHDDFSYARGGRQSQFNGQDPVSKGDLHSVMFTYGRPQAQVVGNLKLTLTEDDSVKGPDGKPGVLRMEFEELPAALDFAGFVITGNQETDVIQIEGRAGQGLTYEDAERTYVSFRFRAASRDDATDLVVRGIYFRVEPDIEGSFQWGADFGELVATRAWRTMKRPLSSTHNLDAFLAAVSSLQSGRIKLVWSHPGPLSVNQSGDALLIDDLTIAYDPAAGPP